MGTGPVAATIAAETRIILVKMKILNSQALSPSAEVTKKERPVTNRHYPPHAGSSLPLIACLVTLAAFAPVSSLAQPAQTSGYGLPAVRSLFPGKPVTPDKQSGWFQVQGQRDYRIALAPFGFRIEVYWNGIGDPDEIIASAASRYCGRIMPQQIARDLSRLYDSRSLVAQRELGGNAGSTFKKRRVASMGQCTAIYQAQGARGHTLSATIVRQ